MFAKKTLVFAAGVATASAACAPTTQLGGNAVVKPDGSNTPTIGSPFQITYDGTGLGDTVSFILYRGPGNALVSLGSIGEGVANCKTTGCTYTWTPACNLEPDTTRYGIQLLDDATCQFQYTTQFGLNAATSGCSAPPASKPPTPPASSAPPKPSGKPSGEPPKPSGDHPKPSEHPKPSGSGYPHPPYPTETDCEDETYTAWTSVYKPKATGGYVHTNGTGTAINAATPSATYKPVLSNDAGRTMVGAAGAIGVLAVALLL